MNLHDYLSVAPEIAEALAAGKPVVALESTILSHGMPYPENVEFAHKVEKIVHNLDETFSIHDFRMVKGTTRTNLIFDVEVPRKTS